MHDLAAEALAAVEDPREPMVSYIRVNLARDLPPARLERAVCLLLAANPKLRASARFEGRHLVWDDPAEDVATLAERVIVAQPVADFLNARIPLAPGPIWRLVLEASSLHIAVHHALCDGTAIFRILEGLFRAIEDDAAGRDVTAPLSASDREKNVVGGDRSDGFVVGRTILKKTFWARLYPPVLLGPRTPRDGTRCHQLYHTLDRARFGELRRALIDGASLRNLTDTLLMALHLAVDEEVRRAGRVRTGGDDRIGVLVPLDLRGVEPVEGALCNCVGTVTIVSYRRDRRDVARLLLRIQKQTRRFEEERRRSSSMAILRHFARRAERGLPPPRYTPTTANWRFDNTACLSHIPRVDFSGPGADWVGGVFGAPPVQTPMGLSIGVGGHKGRLEVCMRYSDACLEPDRAQALFGRFLELLTTLPRLVAEAT
jgi:hypothetical protein